MSGLDDMIVRATDAAHGLATAVRAADREMLTNYLYDISKGGPEYSAHVIVHLAKMLSAVSKVVGIDDDEWPLLLQEIRQAQERQHQAYQNNLQGGS